MTWPNPNDHIPFSKDGHRFYPTTEGTFLSVTQALKAINKGEGLVTWAGNVERQSAINAAVEAWMESSAQTPDQFIAEIERKLPDTRASVKTNEKAKDIGTNVHEYIKWFHRKQLGEVYPEPKLYTDEATVAWMAYEDHWKKGGFVAVRSEQPVWCPALKSAGTVDLIVEAESGLELHDFKAAKAIYDEHHVQAATYMHMARRWAPIVSGKIIHLPKTIEQTEVKVVSVGDLNPLFRKKERRSRSEEELVAMFRAALVLYQGLMT